MVANLVVFSRNLAQLLCLRSEASVALYGSIYTTLAVSIERFLGKDCKETINIM